MNSELQHLGLPWSDEAEKCVLGSMMRGGLPIVGEVQEKLSPEAFHSPIHKTICIYLFAASAAGLPIDPVIFTQTLRDAGELDAVGGPSLITELFTFVPTPVLVGHYMDIVREKWVLRGLIRNCTDICRRAYEEQDDVEALLSDHVAQAIKIGETASRAESLVHIRDIVPGAVKEIEAAFDNRGEPMGLPSGFKDLDRMTNGFLAPQTYYFAGRPAMGKSSVMVDVAEHIAITNAANGDHVGIFSIEMTARQLAKRLICDVGSINLQRVRDGFFAKTIEDETLDRPTLDKVRKSGEIVSGGNIWIDETSDLSIQEFRARARRAVVKCKCKILIIDYLQRMRSTSKRAAGNREQEINEIAQGISATAKELGIPIIVLAQLNRKSDDRTDKVPALSDLRESGSIEQEARFVGLLHRPAYYIHGSVQGEGGTDVSPEMATQSRLKKIKKAAAIAGLGSPDVGEDGRLDPDWKDPDEEGDLTWVERFEMHAELIVAKQNEGPVGVVRLKFISGFARFENVTKKLYSNNPDERQQKLDDGF